MINIRDLIVHQGFVKAIMGSGGGSDGDANIKVAKGGFTGNGASVIVNHNLGVVPDIFIVYTTVGTSGCLGVAVGYSAPFVNHFSLTGSGFYSKWSNSVVNYNTSVSLSTISTSMALSSATEETVKVGGSAAGYPGEGDRYYWIAIGGLT